MMKKWKALLTAALLLISVSACAGSEESGKLTNAEGFVYQIGDDGCAVVVGYTGSAKDLVIPEELDSIPVAAIGDQAFAYNKSIKTAVIPGCVRSVGVNAFEFCTGLTSVEIREGTEEMKHGVFWYCENLKDVSVPMSVRSMGQAVFFACDSLKTVTLPADHPYLAFADDVLFSLPDRRLVWYPAGKKESGYTVPEGTEIIETYAFTHSAVKEIVIPESVSEIREKAFHGCKNLTTVNVPLKVVSLNGVFSSCEKVENIIIPDEHPALKSIDGVVFTRNPQELVFYPRAKKDKKYAVPDGTAGIAEYALQGNALTAVEIPGSVKVIGGNAFDESEKLKTVVIGEGVETFGAFPFQNCSSLTEIRLPASLTDVEQNPFLRCFKLKKVTVAEGNPSLIIIDGALVNRSTKTLLWYPVTSKAKSYTVPEGVETISVFAFYQSKLTELILPEGVKSFLRLNECKSFKKIVLPASLETIEIEKSMDLNLSGITFVVVPGSYAENYCQAYRLKYEYAK